MIKIFADGANKKDIIAMNQDPLIQGFTTNPTLMKKAGISDYEGFAKEILEHVNTKPISFEVFDDDFENMYTQAKKIDSWAENVYVKIPVMNTKGQDSYELIRRLSESGVKLNITAIFTLNQIEEVKDALHKDSFAFVSVFAGRIADTGIDPVPVMKKAVNILHPYKNFELLWASPREILNLYQAEEIGCHIITATPDLIQKIALKDKDLNEYSKETVLMFYNDAKNAGYNL